MHLGSVYNFLEKKMLQLDNTINIAFKAVNYSDFTFHHSIIANYRLIQQKPETHLIHNLLSAQGVLQPIDKGKAFFVKEHACCDMFYIIFVLLMRKLSKIFAAIDLPNFLMISPPPHLC